MVNIQYLLVEANKVKVGGYDTISLNFLVEAANFLYGDSQRCSKLVQYYVGKQTGGYIMLRSLCAEFPYNKKYLLSCEESGVLRSICIKANTNPLYAELAFLLLVCGMANSDSILWYFKDVSAVAGRVTVRNKGTDEQAVSNTSVSSNLWVTVGFYARLMVIYIENTTKGNSYGFNVYDFVFHIVEICGRKWDKIVTFLGRLEIENWSVFVPPSKDFLAKYRVEITCMLPYLMGNVRLGDKVVVRLLALANHKLQKALYMNDVFISKTYENCTVEM